MIQAKPSSQRHFRGKPRPGRRVELSYQIVDAHETGPSLAAFTANIGIGGAFIVTNDPAPPGTRIAVSLAVPPSGQAPARTIVVQGEVRWICDAEPHDGEAGHASRARPPEPGMGVRFFGLGVDETLALNDYFATLSEIVARDDVAG
jgi:hypothetical protein